MPSPDLQTKGSEGVYGDPFGHLTWDFEGVEDFEGVKGRYSVTCACTCGRTRYEKKPSILAFEAFDPFETAGQRVSDPFAIPTGMPSGVRRA